MNSRNHKTRFAWLLASAACLSGTAVAQDLGLDEIVVSAQKRSQAAQDVPIALSAIGGEKLEEIGIQTMEDISRVVPALEVQSNTSPVQSNFRMRRVGNLGNITTFEPAVGLFVDGAFRSRSVFGLGELYDLERVEVLRGPQSTLYGKNTTGGVIGVYTREPGEEFSGGGELTAGVVEGGNTESMFNLRGAFSGPVAGTVRAGLSGAYANQGEVMDQALTLGGESGNGQDRYALRGQIAADLTESLSARLIAGFARDDSKQQSEDIFFDPAGFIATVILPTFQGAGISDTCSDNDPDNRVSCIRNATTSEVDAQEVTLLFDYAFANGITLNSITSYDHYKFEGTKDDVAQVMAPLLKFHDTQENTSFQQEIRLTSAGGEKFDWLVGAFYFDADLKTGDEGNRPMFLADTLSADATVAAINQALLSTPAPTPFGSPGQLGFLDGRQETEYFGVFGQGTLHLSDSLSLTGGLRWQTEEKNASIIQSVNDPTFSIISALLSPAAVSGSGLSRDASEVTWSITPQYYLNENTMAFATVAHGFKSGGFNVGFGPLPIASREFDDEDIMHYEAGVKSDLLNNRLRLSASAFYTEYEDYQDAAFIGAQFTVGNAEKAELKGFEVEGNALLTETLSLDFAVSYADFKYDKNTSGQCFPGRASDSPTTPGACDLSGERPVNAPKFKSHLGLAYSRPTSWGDVYARADWSYTSEYNTSFSADPLLKQPGYSWINMRAGTNWDNYELVLWVENLTDETVANFDAVVNIYAGDGSYQSYLQPPRSFGITGRINF